MRRGLELPACEPADRVAVVSRFRERFVFPTIENLTARVAVEVIARLDIGKSCFCNHDE